MVGRKTPRQLDVPPDLVKSKQASGLRPSTPPPPPDEAPESVHTVERQSQLRPKKRRVHTSYSLVAARDGDSLEPKDEISAPTEDPRMAELRKLLDEPPRATSLDLFQEPPVTPSRRQPTPILRRKPEPIDDTPEIEVHQATEAPEIEVHGLDLGDDFVDEETLESDDWTKPPPLAPRVQPAKIDALDGDDWAEPPPLPPRVPPKPTGPPARLTGIYKSVAPFIRPTRSIPRVDDDAAVEAPPKPASAPYIPSPPPPAATPMAPPTPPPPSARKMLALGPRGSNQASPAVRAPTPPPLSAPPARPSDPGPVSAKHQGPKRRTVVLVSEEAKIQADLSRVLKLTDAELVVVKSALEAVAVLYAASSEMPIVLVFVDSLLVLHKDAAQMIEQLRANARPGTRIMLVGAFSADTLDEMRKTSMLDGFLASNKGLLHMDAAIQKWLGSSAPPPPASASGRPLPPSSAPGRPTPPSSAPGRPTPPPRRSDF